MFKNLKIITSLVELKLELKTANVLGALIICNAKFLKLGNKGIKALIDNKEYVVFRNEKDEITCVNLLEIGLNTRISFYDIILLHYSFNETKSFSEIVNLKDQVNPLANENSSSLVSTNLTEILKGLFGIKSNFIKKETHEVFEGNIYNHKESLLGIELLDINQKKTIDFLVFNDNSFKTLIKNPEGSLKHKLELVPLRKTLNFLFNPDYLFTKNSKEHKDTPYIILNDSITQIEIDKILFNEITSDKEVVKHLDFNIITKPTDNQIGVVQIIHYLLNNIIDFVHFNLEVKKNYVNIFISWKASEGITRQIRMDLTTSLISSIQKLIYDNHYSKLFNAGGYSEHVDLLLNRKHNIEKRQSFVNKKKDVLVYKCEINSLSLYWYCQYMIKVFNLSNITIQPCLKY